MFWVICLASSSGESLGLKALRSMGPGGVPEAVGRWVPWGQLHGELGVLLFLPLVHECDCRGVGGRRGIPFRLQGLGQGKHGRL